MSRNSSVIVNFVKIPEETEVLGEELEVENKLFDAKNIFIFCEGMSEFNYFTGFDDIHNNSRLKIIPRYPRQSTGQGNSGEGCDYEKLCSQVKTSITTKKVEINHNSRIISYDVLNNDEFNIVFDCDQNFDIINRNNSTKYRDGNNIVSTLKVNSYLSNYSFEIWILCHFEIPPNNLMNNSNLEIREILPNRIKVNYIHDYHKNDILIFRKLKDLTGVALNNSKILLNQKKSQNIKIHSKLSEPVTEIGILLTKLKKIII